MLCCHFEASSDQRLDILSESQHPVHISVYTPGTALHPFFFPPDIRLEEYCSQYNRNTLLKTVLHLHDFRRKFRPKREKQLSQPLNTLPFLIHFLFPPHSS